MHTSRSRRRVISTVLVLALAVAPDQARGGDSCAHADDPSTDAIVAARLVTGETLEVTYRGCEQQFLLLEHPLLGLLRVPRSGVVSLAAQPSAPQLATTTPSALAPVAGSHSKWLVGVELGLNGALGNSQSYNLRLSARGQRDSNNGELLAEVTYIRAEAASSDNRDADGNGVADRPNLELTDSKLLASLRNDWLSADGPWRYFVEATADADQFKDYDLRWSIASGPGYSFLNSTDSTVVGRIGAGLSEELGGEDQSLVPELLFGGDWKHRLSQRQKLTAKLTVYPDLSAFGELRSVVKGSWDIDLDPQHNLKLRLGIEDRYDSKPEDEIVNIGGVDLPKRTEHNDLDYYATLLFEF